MKILLFALVAAIGYSGIHAQTEFKQNQQTYPRVRNAYHEIEDSLLAALSLYNLPEDHAFYSLSYYWVNQQYDSAFAFNKRNAELITGRNRQLYNLTSSFEQQKYKKPMVALAMSAVIPGSGKAYSKRWGDAAISFLFVTTSAWASYRAFKQKGVRSFNGWMFGGIAFSFYTSGLYGSFKAARTHNELLRFQFQNNAEDTIYYSY